MNNQKRKDIIWTLLLIISVFSFIFFGYKTASEYLQIEQIKSETMGFTEKYTKPIALPEVDEKTNNKPDPKEPVSANNPAVEPRKDDSNTKSLSVDLNAAKDEIEDLRGWLYIPQIGLNEPVVQGDDNEYYLNHSAVKTRTNIGAIFMEAGLDANLENNFVSYIFGHRTDVKNQRFSNLDTLANNVGSRFSVFQNDKEYVYEVLDYLQVPPTTSLYPKNLFKENGVKAFSEALESNLARKEVYENISENEKYLLLVTCLDYTDASQRKVAVTKLVTVK